MVRHAIFGWLAAAACCFWLLLMYSSGIAYKYWFPSEPKVQEVFGIAVILLLLLTLIQFFRTTLRSNSAPPSSFNVISSFVVIIAVLLYWASPTLAFYVLVSFSLLFLGGAIWFTIKEVQAAEMDGLFYLLGWTVLFFNSVCYLSQFVLAQAWYLDGWLCLGVSGMFSLAVFAYGIAYRNIRLALRKDGLRLSEITELKMITEQSADALHVERANSSAKNVFLQSVTQNVKDPLHAFYGNIQLLSTSELDSGQKEKLNCARENANRLFFHMENLITYTEILRDDIVPIETKANVEDEIEDVVDNWLKNIEHRQVTIKTVFDDDLPSTLFAEWVHVRKVLRVLFDSVVLKNKINDCEVFVSSHLQGCEGALVIHLNQIELASNKLLDNWVKESIQSDEWEGLGLEFFVGRKIIEVLGARLTKLKKEQSLSLKFEFPCRLAKDEYNSATRVSFPNVKILVVDDNRVNIQVMIAMLSRLGVSCDSAQSGEQAIAKIQQDDYDLILLDCLMPGLSGQDTAKKIRSTVSSNQNCPIIAVSANSSDKDRESCLKAGMNDFMSKPVRIEKVAKFLSRWVPEY